MERLPAAACLALLSFACGGDEPRGPTAPSALDVRSDAVATVAPGPTFTGTEDSEVSPATANSYRDVADESALAPIGDADGLLTDVDAGGVSLRPTQPTNLRVRLRRNMEPDKPLDYNGVMLQHVAIGVEFGPPASAGGIDNYRIQYWPRFGSRRNRNELLGATPGNDNRIWVPYGRWTFAVTPHTRRGWGLATIRRNYRVRPTTTAAGTVGRPGRVGTTSVSAIGRYRYRLRWSPPTDLGGLPVHRYLTTDRGCRGSGESSRTIDPRPKPIHEQYRYNPSSSYSTQWATSAPGWSGFTGFGISAVNARGEGTCVVVHP